LRSTTDTLRRGLDSMLANWPLIAIRIVESFLFLLIVIGSVVAAIIPIAVAAGFSNFDITNRDNAAEAIASIVIGHWPLILYILVIITMLLIVLVAVHSFVEAGNAKIFVDAEHAAGSAMAANRQTYRTFTMDRWLQGGWHSWWTIFWIYNLAWSVAALVILVPLLMTLVGMFLVEEPGPKIAVGCGGLAISFIIGIPVSLIVAIWTQKAIAVCVARAATAGASLRQAWAAIRADFGRHLAVAFILFVVTFGGAMLISTFTMPFSLIHQTTHTSPLVEIAFAPARIIGSFLQSIFSAAVGLWFLASFVGLTEER
jgi:hypothetical protein